LLKDGVFILFLKLVLCETVRKSAGREFHAMGQTREGESLPSEFAVQLHCDVVHHI